MKDQIQKLRAKVEAISVRERVMVFAACAAVIVFVLYTFMLNPLFAKEKVVRAELRQQQNNMAGIDAEITAFVQNHARDPDSAERARLATLHKRNAELGSSLRSMQTGLVAPERIAPLLEAMLKSNRRLRLLALKSLPVSPLTSSAATEAKPLQPGASLIYRHGVELAVRGNYLDMVEYLDALEAMPSQLFWGKASLEVEEYPNARLTLTLYTLSLDQKWMKL